VENYAMLKRHSQFFKSLMLVNDLVFLTLSWWLAYLLRFYVNFPFVPESYVFRHYVIAWLLILLIFGVVFHVLDLYRPRRISTHLRETADLFKGVSLAMLIFFGVIFLLREIILSRVVVVLFWAFSASFLNLSHLLVREGLRYLRRKGKNLRYVVVVGAPAQAKRLVHPSGLRSSKTKMTLSTRSVPETLTRCLLRFRWKNRRA
jgi:FlaA1/EpsC-like NDP-sugar epimerase